MATRERPGDRGAREARELLVAIAGEIRGARNRIAMSLGAAARRAGMSPSQLDRLELGLIEHPTFDQVFRASRAVGQRPWFKLFPDDAPVRDTPQLKVFGRFAAILAPPLRLRLRREVVLPIAGDRRAWDGRVTDDERTASIEVESKLGDVQALSRRIELKLRDDPDAGVVILVLNRTAHNRRVLADHREALRAQFPLDGAAVARELRRGRVPPASGILLV